MRKSYYIILAGGIWLASCKKEDSGIAANRGTVAYVVADNFNLSYFSAALRRTGLEANMKEAGPFTALSPSDDAYKALGYNTTNELRAAPFAQTYAQTHYLLLKGDIAIKGLPLEVNKAFPSLAGSDVYMSRVVKRGDTLTTINGARLLRTDIQATNGKVQVIDKVLRPMSYKTTDLAIASQANLTLFHQALVRSGVLAALQTGAFTVFAPDNAAMRAYGYADMEAVNAADATVLAAWVKYHLAPGRNFAQDYFIRAGEGETSITETMHNGNALTVNILSQSNVPNSFTGINLRGAANSSNASTSATDILAGNGVVHIINQVLRP